VLLLTASGVPNQPPPSRFEHEAAPGGVLISFETYAHVKDDDGRCEERGHVLVKGNTQAVATYAGVELNKDAERARIAHLRLEFDAGGMSDVSAR
jgi:hypothetical protein